MRRTEATSSQLTARLAEQGSKKLAGVDSLQEKARIHSWQAAASLQMMGNCVIQQQLTASVDRRKYAESQET